MQLRLKLLLLINFGLCLTKSKGITNSVVEDDGRVNNNCDACPGPVCSNTTSETNTSETSENIETPDIHNIWLKQERAKIIRALKLEGSPYVYGNSSQHSDVNRASRKIPQAIIDQFMADAKRYKATEELQSPVKNIYIIAEYDFERNGSHDIFETDYQRNERLADIRGPTEIASIRCKDLILRSKTSRCFTISVPSSIFTNYDVSRAKLNFVLSNVSDLNNDAIAEYQNYTLRLIEQTKLPNEPNKSFATYSSVFRVLIQKQSQQNKSRLEDTNGCAENCQNFENPNSNESNKFRTYEHDLTNLFNLWQRRYLNSRHHIASRVEHSLIVDCLDCDDDDEEILNDELNIRSRHQSVSIQNQIQYETEVDNANANSSSAHYMNDSTDNKDKHIWFPLVISGDDRPTLALTISKRRPQATPQEPDRSKRAMKRECLEGCCKIDYWVTMESLDLSQTVQFPTGYLTAHCVGGCRYITDTAIAGVIRLTKPTIPPEFRRSGENSADGNDNRIYACCKPYEVEELSMLYFDNTYRHGRAPVIVKSCIC